MMIHWKIYYADGSTFSNLDGSWEDAPAWGILGIVIKSKETGWSIVSGGDFYVMTEDGEIINIDRLGFADYIVNVFRKAKVGRMVGREEWLRLSKTANQDKDFAVKTGYLPFEEKPG